MRLYRGVRASRTSEDVIPIVWYTTDLRYAKEYGPRVDQYEIKLLASLDLRSITKTYRRTVAEWVRLLRRKGLPVSLLDSEWGDVDVPLWDLLRGAENIGAETATDFGEAILRSGVTAVLWYEVTSNGRRVTAVGILR